MSENMDQWMLLRQILILLWDKWAKGHSEKKQISRMRHHKFVIFWKLLSHEKFRPPLI